MTTPVVTVEPLKRCTVVFVAAFGHSESELFLTEIAALIEQGNINLVLSMANEYYEMSWAHLDWLENLIGSCKQLGGRIAVCDIQPRLFDQLSRSDRLSRYEVFEHLYQAVGSF
jgi:hypothetical protein